MKSWNHRHPNAVLVFFIALWVVYGLGAITAVYAGEWFWVVVNLLAFMWADSRCRYWYNKTGEEK